MEAEELRKEFHEKAQRNKVKFDLLIKLKKEIFGKTEDSIEDDLFTLNLFEYAEAYHKGRVKAKMATYNDSFISPSRETIEREKIEFNVLKQLLTQQI